MDYEKLRAEFDRVLEAREGSISVDSGKLQEEIQKLCIELLWADFVLERSEGPDDDRHAMGLAAHQFALFAKEVFGDGVGIAAKRLFVALKDRHTKGVLAAELQPEQGRGDTQETSFADHVRDAAVTLMGALQKGGLKQKQAAECIAKTWNDEKGLFAKFKAATGNRGSEFRATTITDWWKKADIRPGTPRSEKHRPFVEKTIRDYIDDGISGEQFAKKFAGLLLADVSPVWSLI